MHGSAVRSFAELVALSALSACPGPPPTCFGSIGVDMRLRVKIDSSYDSTTPFYSTALDNTNESLWLSGWAGDRGELFILDNCAL